MIEGHVNDDGVPYIPMKLDEREWMAVVDTGFNGGLDLPMALKERIPGVLLGKFDAELAGGYMVSEDIYRIRVVFDADEMFVPASFSDSTEVLIGTRLLRHHRIEINFPSKTVRITRP